jgi:molybdenum cofactor biosynthesis enzyme MoaA
LVVRFIEYMPFDGRHAWSTDKLISGEEIIQKIEAVLQVGEAAARAGKHIHGIQVQRRLERHG